jgi:hypothetical protein
MAALGAVIAAHSVSLRSQTATRKALEEAKGLNCVFTVYATVAWNNGAPHAELKVSQLAARFEGIDTQDGSARAVGMPGPSYAVARLTAGSLHLMMIDNDGPLYVTTVFDREARPGKLLAVHTRHEYTDVSLPGFTSRPEQYYGECEVVR